MKIYREFGLCGAYNDLDGHYGNSIDNSRDFVPDIDKAISPVCGNINIMSRNAEYLEELKANFLIIRHEIIENNDHYVVFCHGAVWFGVGYCLIFEVEKYTGDELFPCFF